MVILIDDLIGDEDIKEKLEHISTEDLIIILTNVFEEINTRPQSDVDTASDNVLSGIIGGE